MIVRNVSLFILYTPEGKILLQHRSKDAERLPNYWGFFGGGIEQGESPEQALKREVVEELSYDVRNPYFLTTQKYILDETEGTKYVFVEKYDNDPLELGEGQAMEWFYPDEIEKLQMSDYDRSLVQQIKTYLDGKR